MNNSTLTEIKTHIRGGEFLVRESDPHQVFTPDDYTEEQNMMRLSIREFYAQYIDPLREEFDKEGGCLLVPPLLEKMGQMGFLGIGVPPEYGGMETDFKTQLVAGEAVATGHSFSTGPGIQSSIGIAPVLLYGNASQKQKYLPGIVDCSIKACYCLTEPGSGSDANAAKSRAVLSPDGSHYILNGQKMWITSSGHADIFYVFAKIENDKNLSCFIVEKAFGGIVLGNEERKMGIKGSSTRQVFFENVPIPVENLLGERDGGLKIALNVLNAGRIKIATAACAGGKRSFHLGLNYALQRAQFGQNIIQFGAIRQKIAEMATRLYAMESIFCRIGQMIDLEYDALVTKGVDATEAKYQSIAEFAMECAMAKVYNTEGEGMIVDESVQIHGGMGYSADSEIATLYCNARSSRIYEGTNEINRILAPSMLLRKVMKGQLDLMGPASEAGAAVLKGEWPAFSNNGWETEKSMLDRLKKAALTVAGSAAQKFMLTLQDEQEVLMHLSNIFMGIFAFETALLRTMKYDGPFAAARQAVTRLLMHHAANTTRQAGTEIIHALKGGAAMAPVLRGLEICCATPADNLIDLRRRISDHFAAQATYKI